MERERATTCSRTTSTQRLPLLPTPALPQARSTRLAYRPNGRRAGSSPKHRGVSTESFGCTRAIPRATPAQAWSPIPSFSPLRRHRHSASATYPTRSKNGKAGWHPFVRPCINRQRHSCPSGRQRSNRSSPLRLKRREESLLKRSIPCA